VRDASRLSQSHITGPGKPLYVAIPFSTVWLTSISCLGT
jgi:hypothetical protein